MAETIILCKQETINSLKSEDLILKTMEQIFRGDSDSLAEWIDSSPYGNSFYSYYKAVYLNPTILNGYAQLKKHIFEVANPKGKIVLDACCGYGLHSILSGITGAKRVVGIDISRERIKIFKTILDSLRQEANNVKAMSGNVHNLPFKDESFDVIYLIEGVAHVGDVDSTFSEVTRLLKVGGLLYILEGNNALNPFLSRSTTETCYNPYTFKKMLHPYGVTSIIRSSPRDSNIRPKLKEKLNPFRPQKSAKASDKKTNIRAEPNKRNVKSNSSVERMWKLLRLFPPPISLFASSGYEIIGKKRARK